MHSERFRPLVDAKGPFVSIYFDDSHDTQDAAAQLDARLRDVRKHLEEQSVDTAVIEAIDGAVRGAHPPVGRSGRAVIAAGDTIVARRAPDPAADDHESIRGLRTAVPGSDRRARPAAHRLSAGRRRPHRRRHHVHRAGRVSTETSTARAIRCTRPSRPSTNTAERNAGRRSRPQEHPRGRRPRHPAGRRIRRRAGVHRGRGERAHRTGVGAARAGRREGRCSCRAAGAPPEPTRPRCTTRSVRSSSSAGWPPSTTPPSGSPPGGHRPGRRGPGRRDRRAA